MDNQYTLHEQIAYASGYRHGFQKGVHDGCVRSGVVVSLFLALHNVVFPLLTGIEHWEGDTQMAALATAIIYYCAIYPVFFHRAGERPEG